MDNIFENQNQLTQSSDHNKDDQYKTWVEKYRPSKLDEVIYQDEIVQSLKNIISNDPTNLPSFLFYGPPGTGKTSTIIALCKEIFGDQYKQRVLELNASDERGIQVIREKVKNFAQHCLSSSSSIPSIKMIVLDECDSMTMDAQSALRRIMEKYSATTRFCLICNYVSKIIDPIISRCSVFRFKSLRKDLIKSTILNVCQNEGFDINDEAMETLIESSDGDLRQAITLIQTLSLFAESKEINIDDIIEISGLIPEKLIQNFFNTCQSKMYSKLRKEVESIIHSGYSAIQFVHQLQQWISLADESLLNDNQKSFICFRIAQCEKSLLDGQDEFIVLMYIGSGIISSLKNSH